MSIKTKPVTYQASDGAEFDNEEEAQLHDDLVTARKQYDDVGWFREEHVDEADAFIARHNTSLSTAESNLAREVLEQLSTMPGGTHGGGVVVVSRDVAVDRLRELFSRMPHRRSVSENGSV